MSFYDKVQKAYKDGMDKVPNFNSNKVRTYFEKNVVVSKEIEKIAEDIER